MEQQKRRKPVRRGKAAQEADGATACSGGKAVYSVTAAIGNDFVPLDAMHHDHVIVHLNTAGSDDAPFASSVKPYDQSCQDFLAVDNDDASDAREGTEESLLPPTFHTLLGEFHKRTQDGGWPTTTNVWCMWCCHPIEGAPVCLPSRLEQGDGEERRWFVSGCFCSFQCAAAYNFDVNNDSDEVWETYALLNRLHQESTDDVDAERLLPAPPRNVLQVFGGYMSIEEFRAKSQSVEYTRRSGDVARARGVVVDSYRFPMTYVPQQVEEINESRITKPLRFIPVDQDHVNRAREKLQLRRMKPLINSKHTLDRVMNLRIEQ